MRSSPSAWGNYNKLVTEGLVPRNNAASRFAARYRVARSLRAVEFARMSSASNEGYAVGLRVGLAYSALEALEVVVGKGSVRVLDPDLADRFRAKQLRRTQEWMVKNLQNNDLKKHLGQLVNDDEFGDVVPVAAGIRHLVFHGVYTSSGSGAAKSATVRGFFSDLADSVLISGDEHFTDWVEATSEPVSASSTGDR